MKPRGTTLAPATIAAGILIAALAATTSIAATTTESPSGKDTTSPRNATADKKDLPTWDGVANADAIALASMRVDLTPSSLGGHGKDLDELASTEHRERAIRNWWIYLGRTTPLQEATDKSPGNRTGDEK